MIWNELREIIAKNQSFLISAHENPDGDSLGAQLAFYTYLKTLGKKVEIYNKDKVPYKFYFLDENAAINSVEPKQKFSVLVLLDCSNPNRCGIQNIETKFADKIINIDHHRDNTMFGDVNCVDVNAAATCSILYDFFTQNNISYGRNIADFLLCGIITDTGGFQFNNDDGNMYLIANDLVKHGADNKFLFKKIFASNTVSALKIRAKIWETLTFYANEKISVISMHKSLISDYGADNSATEGMANAILEASGLQVGIFVRYDDKETHFSLRSTGIVDVGEIAKTCGIGGGHKFAAGATIRNSEWKKNLDDLIRKIEKKL